MFRHFIMNTYFVIAGEKREIHYDFTHINDLSRKHIIDASYGDIVLPLPENDEYQQFTKDINAAILTGPFILSIFTDASGIGFAQDLNGNDINLRQVASTSYTYPYIDISGNMVVGYYTMNFSDGATFGNPDTNHSAYWYYIEGISDMSNIYQWS